jgi:hypothetical protein
MDFLLSSFPACKFWLLSHRGIKEGLLISSPTHQSTGRREGIVVKIEVSKLRLTPHQRRLLIASLRKKTPMKVRLLKMRVDVCVSFFAWGKLLGQ